MHAERQLIVNGDDFGQTVGTTAGVAFAYEHGVLTSASMMVRWPAAEAAGAYAAAHSGLAVGLHVDFGEWAFGNGDWTPLYEVIPLDNVRAVRLEANKQLGMFRELVGRAPTHLDSHQHVHRREPVRQVLQEMARQLKVPLRGCSPWVTYCGAFYGQTDRGEPTPQFISVDGLLRILAGLQPGCTELACHPASTIDVDGMYRSERRTELQTLCDPEIRDWLRALDIELKSFTDLPWQ